MQAIDKTGRVVWAAEYNAFGEATIITPAATQDDPTINSSLRLPGQYLDEETDLHYNWHRYYDSVTGRYVTEDPLGVEGGSNLFAYVTGAPVTLRDYSGLSFSHKGACVCTNMEMKRRNASGGSAGTDEYGHWWTEIKTTEDPNVDADESYGWWPKKDDVTIVDTIVGTPGELNGQTNHKGSKTRDPKHGQNAPVMFRPEVPAPKKPDPKSKEPVKTCDDVCKEAADCFRKFSTEYSGAWRYPSSSCRSFQEDGMKKCNMKKPG